MSEAYQWADSNATQPIQSPLEFNLNQTLVEPARSGGGVLTTPGIYSYKLIICIKFRTELYARTELSIRRANVRMRIRTHSGFCIEFEMHLTSAFCIIRHSGAGLGDDHPWICTALVYLVRPVRSVANASLIKTNNVGRSLIRAKNKNRNFNFPRGAPGPVLLLRNITQIIAVASLETLLINKHGVKGW